MTRFAWARAIAVLAGLWVSADGACAQPPGPPRLGAAPPPPGYSPYLNLVRRGNSPAVNYYGLVRPQRYFQGAIQNLQADIALGATGGVPGETDGSDLPATGIPVQFMNHTPYFMNLAGAGFGTGPAGPGFGASTFNRGVQGGPAQLPPSRRR